MKIGKLCRDIFLSLTFLFSVSFAQPSFAADWKPSTRFVIAWTLAWTVVLSTYYSIVDANKQSMDAGEWRFDALTIGSALARPIFFVYINYQEKCVIPERAALIGNPVERSAFSQQMHTRLQTLRSPITMLTYNVRFDEVVTKRFKEKYDLIKGLYDDYTPGFIANTYGRFDATISASSYILVNNVWYFLYFMPQLNGKLSSIIQETVWTQGDIAKHAVTHGFPLMVAYTAYVVWDIIMWQINMSVKNFIGGLFPAAADNWPLRFPDCTACFFGTNLLGKSGPIARALKYLCRA